eukprot:365562-Chlamydomonas_euryale.AAC.10
MLASRRVSSTASPSSRAGAPRLVRRAPAVATARPGLAGRRGAVSCKGLFGLGFPEIAVIAGISALVFGPSKLPELGKSLGSTVKSFQTAAKEFETELKTAAAAEEEKKDEKDEKKQGDEKKDEKKSA